MTSSQQWLHHPERSPLRNVIFEIASAAFPRSRGCRRISGPIAQYNGVGPSDGTDRLPATMREILSKSLTLRGFIYYDFGE
jgi:hypothetical protein